MKTQTHTLVSPAVLTAVFTFAALLAMAGQGVAQEGPTGDPIEDDPVLKDLRDGIFGGFATVDTCSSLIDGGETLDDAGVSSLPVGGGRRLECLVDPPRIVVDTVNDSTGAIWCQLETLVGFGPDVLDDRLSLTIVDAPSVGSWTVVATHDGEEIDIIRASGRWPVAVSLSYITADLQPALGRVCDRAFFGL